ncbi:MAG: polysaccharide deacetylase family protein [Oscillospiraceae bacterium]|nr:polysaccharide deacetylase family protein [Oscillospiraceae bacterium]
MRKKLFSILIVFAICFSTYHFSRAQEHVKVPIILYHNITTDERDLSDKPLLNITPENFRVHMQTLKNEGWNTISFQDYYNHVTHNTALPNKPIIITFDDGYLSNYIYAFPVLKELGMKATIFTVAGRVGEGVSLEVTYPHFTWEQAKDMENSGVISIESHSNMHYNMSNSSDIDRLQVELRRSKFLIEKHLNKECAVFAFPFGGKTDLARELGKQAGYKMLCLVGDVGSNSAGEDLDRLKRITIRGYESPEQLINTITKNLI